MPLVRAPRCLFSIEYLRIPLAFVDPLSVRSNQLPTPKKRQNYEAKKNNRRGGKLPKSTHSLIYILRDTDTHNSPLLKYSWTQKCRWTFSEIIIPPCQDFTAHSWLLYILFFNLDCAPLPIFSFIALLSRYVQSLPAKSQISYHSFVQIGCAFL